MYKITLTLDIQVTVEWLSVACFRQRADGSIRSHRKHMSALQSALSTIQQTPQASKVSERNVEENFEVSLEKGKCFKSTSK